MIPNYSMIPVASIRWSPGIWWSPGIRWSPAIRWSIRSMDFDNRKVYGDTSITDGLVSHVPSSNTNALCHQNNKTLIIIIIVLWSQNMPRGTHPPPLQGGLIAAGGTTTGRTELDSVEILDRYYCKFKPPSSSYQSLIVVGLKSRKWASFLLAGARECGGVGRGCRENLSSSGAGCSRIYSPSSVGGMMVTTLGKRWVCVVLFAVFESLLFVGI